MAQTIHLKRSSTQHKVPSTSNLALGELAINTYDGRVFFKKNDGSDSVEHIVTTDSITTGSVSIIGSLVVDDITIDGSTISDSGDFTLDVGGDITLDANGADIVLKDDGTAFGRFKRDTSDFIIKSETNDKDIIFKGVDNSSTISALTLDMSAAGAATFHGGIANAGTIAAGTWNGSAISTTYLSNTSGTNTGDETKTSINALDITEVGTIDSGVWNGTAIASAYLDSDTAHLSGTQTFSGTKTFTNESTHNGGIKLGNDDKIRWTSDDVYIAGTTSSDNIDFVVGAGSRFNISQTDIDMKVPVNVDDATQSTTKTTGCMIIDGGVGIAKTLNVGEDVVAYASSDERYKDNIIPIRNPNEKIKQIGGYTFDWNDKHEIFKGKKDIGVVAQEIEKVLPEIVETRDNGFKAVKYEKIVALLIESNKELIKRVEELESKIK